MNKKDLLLKQFADSLKSLNRNQLLSINMTIKALLINTDIEIIKSEGQHLVERLTAHRAANNDFKPLTLDKLFDAIVNFTEEELFAFMMITENTSKHNLWGTVSSLSPSNSYINIINSTDIFPNEIIPHNEPEQASYEVSKLYWQAIEAEENKKSGIAIDLLDKAIAIAEKNGIPTFDLRVYREWASWHDMQRLIVIYQEKLSFYQQRNDVFAQVGTLDQMSEYAMRLGNKQEALAYLDNAEDILFTVIDTEKPDIFLGWPDNLRGYLKTRLMIKQAFLKRQKDRILKS